MLDYGARFYDPAIGRWNTLDPVLEKYSSWSPYQYCINNPIIIKDVNGEDGVIVITGIVLKGGSENSRISSGDGNYHLYAVHMYNDMTQLEYERASRNQSILPDATMYIARDAWMSDSKVKGTRSTKRFGKYNEAPLGWHYMEYDPDKVSADKNHYIRITDELGKDYILGPDGERTGIHFHEWSPHDALGCPTSGESGKNNETPGLDLLLELMPELEDPTQVVRVLIEDRMVYYDAESKTWRGETDEERKNRFFKKLSDDLYRMYQIYLMSQ